MSVVAVPTTRPVVGWVVKVNPFLTCELGRDTTPQGAVKSGTGAGGDNGTFRRLAGSTRRANVRTQ